MPGKREPGITPLWETAERNCKIRNSYIRESIAEFLGTAILCFFSTGAGIESISMGYPFLYAVLGGVMGITTAVFVTGGISGAHINPSITFAMAIAGKLSWFKVPVYWIAQFFGAYVGAGFASIVYWAITHDDTTGKFLPEFCYAFSHIGTVKVGTGFIDQIATTGMLVMAVFGLIDQKNVKLPFYMLPFMIAMIVTGISLTFGVQAGAAMNPARDLSPRFMALSLGCDSKLIMKSGNEHWWLATFFGPLIGAAIGTFLYIFLIGAHVTDEEEEDDDMEAMKALGREYNPTRFIPKAQAPQIPMLPHTQAAPFNSRQHPSQQGMNNPGYDGRDDPRFRNGY